MREHDLELIAALVEGRLEDESEARALIDSSPELRDEYEAQKIAFESLRSLGPVSMTESERAVLHRDVWTELRREPEGGGRRAGAWYYRWVAVAGGALVMVGLVAVLGQGVGGEGAGDETFAEIAADLDAGGATTTAAASEDDAGADRASEEGDEAADSPETMEDTGTTEAGESAPTELDGTEASFYSAEADKVRAGEFSAPLEGYQQSGSDPEIGSCVTAAGLDDHQVVATLTPPPELEQDGRLAVAIPDEADPTTAPVAFVSLDECQVTHVDE